MEDLRAQSRRARYLECVFARLRAHLAAAESKVQQTEALLARAEHKAGELARCADRERTPGVILAQHVSFLLKSHGVQLDLRVAAVLGGHGASRYV